MTKANIVTLVSEKLGFSKKEAADIVEIFFDIIKESLRSGRTVKISGFGNFVVRQKRTRVGRNPQTGAALQIQARKVLTFKASQLLKGSVRST
jgi:integration host factor subunit alpha